jgi:hypothetical protein
MIILAVDLELSKIRVNSEYIFLCNIFYKLYINYLKMRKNY